MKQLFKNMLYCSGPVLIFGLYIHLGHALISSIAYFVAVLVTAWIYLDALGDWGARNTLILFLFNMPFFIYLAFKAIAEIKGGPLQFDMLQQPVMCSMMLMGSLLYSGVYVLLLNDGKIRTSV